MRHPTIIVLAVLVSSQAACVLAPSSYYPSPAYHPSPAPLDDRLRVRVTTLIPYYAAGTEGPPAEIARSQEGRLIWADADSIRLYSKQHRRRVTIPVSSIMTIEVHRDQKGSAKAAVEDGVTGAAAGALVGGLLGFASEAILGGIWDGNRDYGKAIGEGALVGAFTGGTLGAVSGAMAGEEVWEAMTLRELREELCMCRIEETVVAQQQ